MCWVAVLLLTFGYFSSFLHILGTNFHFRETLYFLYSGQAPLLYLAPWQPSEEDLSRCFQPGSWQNLLLKGAVYDFGRSAESFILSRVERLYRDRAVSCLPSEIAGSRSDGPKEDLKFAVFLEMSCS